MGKKEEEEEEEEAKANKVGEEEEEEEAAEELREGEEAKANRKVKAGRPEVPTDATSGLRTALKSAGPTVTLRTVVLIHAQEVVLTFASGAEVIIEASTRLARPVLRDGCRTEAQTRSWGDCHPPQFKREQRYRCCRLLVAKFLRWQFMINFRLDNWWLQRMRLQLPARLKRVMLRPPSSRRGE